MKYVLPFYLLALLQVVVSAQTDPDLDEVEYRLDSVEQRAERYERLTDEQNQVEVEIRGDTAAIGSGVRAVGDFVRPQAALESGASNLLGKVLGIGGGSAATVAGVAWWALRRKREIPMQVQVPGTPVTVNVDADGLPPASGSGRFRKPV